MQTVLRLAIAALLAAAMPSYAMDRKSLATNDGAEISYWQSGSGKALVFLPGWSQSADQFEAQSALAETFQVTAVDLRGHGESSKVDYGYRIHRLAKDVHDLIEAEGLDDVTLVGHSMGASVIWAYWDLYRDEHIDKIVVVDQTPSCAFNPDWSSAEKAAAGGLWDYNGLAAVSDQIKSSEAQKFASDFVNSAFFTSAFPQHRKDEVLIENMKLPRQQAARLIFNHCSIDWRDLIATINVPMLIIGGEKSIFSVASLEWIRDTVPGARLEIFTEEEGGSHFMFMENPEKFNALIADFVGQ